MIAEIGYSETRNLVLTFTSGSDKVILELPPTAPGGEEPLAEPPRIVLAK
jgi:hypothetical protein